MKPIEGNDTAIFCCSLPCNDSHLEERIAAATVINIFNAIRDLHDCHQNTFCKELYDHLGPIISYVPSTKNGDFIELLLSHIITRPVKTTAEECLATLHEVTQILCRKGLSGKAEPFKKI